MILSLAAIGIPRGGAVEAGSPDLVGDEVAARQTIDRFHRSLVELAGVGYRDLAARVAALGPVVRATHDLPYIARFTLRRQWDDLADPQRRVFLEAFQRLSVTTYATRFDAVTNDTFVILKAGPAGRGRIQVEAAINRLNGEPIPLTYLLHSSDEGWCIINIIADGVSDLALKRAEYQRVYGARGIDGLLDHLAQLTAALERGE
jgi:phospholipid transport system substrate-binding protein